MSELEQNARIALLAHFSSKSTNEAVILLTETFAFFTFLGFLYSIDFFNFPRDYLVIVALGIFISLASYALGKLIYWGEYANAILRVEMSEMNQTQDQLNKVRDRLLLPEQITLPDGDKLSLYLQPTYLQRFMVACAAYHRARYEKQKDRLLIISESLLSRKWIVLVLASTAVALEITLIIQALL
jgi:hypothetical protein